MPPPENEYRVPYIALLGHVGLKLFAQPKRCSLLRCKLSFSVCAILKSYKNANSSRPAMEGSNGCKTETNKLNLQTGHAIVVFATNILRKE